MKQHINPVSVSTSAMRWRLAFIIVPVITFVLALLVFSRQNTATERSSVDVPSAIDAPAPHDADGRSPPVSATAPVSAAVRDPAPVVATAATASGMPAVTGPGEGDLPVRFFFRAPHQDLGTIASVENLSSESIELTVTAVNAQPHLRSVAELTVQPHQRKNLLLEGLQVGPGDQVTLHRPPFPDKNLAAQ